MPRIREEFHNPQGESLAGLLEMPEQSPRAYALFAHCFTCSKDIAAASRITRALADRGIATLRFDFTGLGNSDGDFSNTNFSSNVQDLIAAANYLEENYEAPALLIGHSLGGAAVLAGAHDLASVRAVVTIGAPSSAKHVEHLFAASHDEIVTANEALVDLGGREFKIKKQFIDDIERYGSTEHIGRLNKALLIFHSPVDATVSIDEAARIYTAARHPKSFVSLDHADHLLSNKEDSEYVASVISSWASRYATDEELAAERSSGTAPSVPQGTVLISERDQKFARGVFTSRHQLIADEPRELGGSNTGPNPYEYLLAALGTCTSMTIRMYANRKGIALDDVQVTLSHTRVHADDCEACESESGLVDSIDKSIALKGALSSAERQRLLAIAERCPVNKTLLNEIVINSVLVE
ncbi:MAG: bifunctional alpha/beta hydrolase/OsmC family protein [Pseudomonadota bacterium]